MEITFSREDAVVTCVSNGHGALAKAREIQPHVVIVDVGLPDGDGYSVCRSLKADPATADLPVLLLANKQAPIDAAKAEACGAEAHSIKPFDTQSMIDRVRALAELPVAPATAAPAWSAGRATPAPAPLATAPTPRAAPAPMAAAPAPIATPAPVSAPLRTPPKPLPAATPRAAQPAASGGWSLGAAPGGAPRSPGPRTTPGPASGPPPPAVRAHRRRHRTKRPSNKRPQRLLPSLASPK